MISTGVAQETDIQAIHKLGANVTEFEVNDGTVKFWPLEVLQNAVGSQDVLIVVAKNQEKEPIGFVVANLNKSLKKVLIENLYVAPSSRGKDVSGMMLAHLFTIISGYGYEYVATLVPPDATNAIKAYENAGLSRGNTFLWLDKSLTKSFKR